MNKPIERGNDAAVIEAVKRVRAAYDALVQANRAAELAEQASRDTSREASDTAKRFHEANDELKSLVLGPMG